MQRLLAGDDAGIGNASDDLGDFRQAAVDGLEHFQRMLVRDIQRALDFAVGGLVDRDPGNRGSKSEQRQREGQRSDHHPLQQSQRIALGGLHGRSDSAPSLTQSLVGNKGPGEPGMRNLCFAAAANPIDNNRFKYGGSRSRSRA